MATPAPADPSRSEEIVRAVVAAVIELLRAVREEVARLQDGAEAFVGRLKSAAVRTLHALQRALLATFLALLFASIAAVVLAVFLVGALNAWLGAPWGTGAAALAFALLALGCWLRARAAFARMEREAAALARRGG